MTQQYRLKQVVDFIDENYHKQITVADIAKVANLSVSRIAHLFTEQMKITFIDYLTNVRLKKACQLLITTQKSCTEICYAVGYKNQSYFTLVFRQKNGTTPQKFRQRPVASGS